MRINKFIVIDKQEDLPTESKMLGKFLQLGYHHII